MPTPVPNLPVSSFINVFRLVLMSYLVGVQAVVSRHLEGEEEHLLSLSDLKQLLMAQNVGTPLPEETLDIRESGIPICPLF